MGDNHRLNFHMEPARGWINDPNGLCFYKDKYHCFFQYCPDSAEGKGRKCWGHFESDDMLSWKYTGIIFEPDIPEDRSGVYSGCAVPGDDGLDIFYTGNVKLEGDYDYVNSGREANQIHVRLDRIEPGASKKVILRNSDYPDYCSCHVRDPKVWKEDGKWHMVLGARTRDDKGCVLLYEGDSPDSFTFKGTLAKDDFGYMWECPDIYELGGRRYLVFSPQGIPHESHRFQNVYSCGYCEIEDGGLSEFEELDYGFDFYAPQSFEAPDGRRIMIAWMGIGDIPYSNPTVQEGYQHCLTLPRVMTSDADGKLLQNPIEEFKKLRGEATALCGEKWSKLPLETEGVCESGKDARIAIGGLSLTWNAGAGEVVLELDEACGYGRDTRRVKVSELKDFRIIADTSCVEIYMNGGRYVMSTRFYPEYPEVKIETEGVTAVLYKLALKDTLVAIGEALIDFIPDKKGCEFYEVGAFAPATGGAPANVCGAFSVLGGKASMITQVGQDPFGDVILRTLDGAGVDTRYVRTTDEANTALAFVSLKKDGDRVFSFYRNPSADMLYDPSYLTPSMFGNCYALHFCSVSLGDFPMKEAHRAAISLAAEQGAIVSFDPNLRFMLWKNVDRLKEAVNEFLPLADIVKISDEELEFITGKTDIKDALPELLKGKTKLVVYTCGKEGAYVYGLSGEAFAPAVRTEAVDTTGAGDGFIGSFLWKLKAEGVTRDTLGKVSSDVLEGCAVFANTFCSISVEGKGAIPSYPTAGRVDERMNK